MLTSDEIQIPVNLGCVIKSTRLSEFEPILAERDRSKMTGQRRRLYVFLALCLRNFKCLERRSMSDFVRCTMLTNSNRWTSLPRQWFKNTWQRADLVEVP